MSVDIKRIQSRLLIMAKTVISILEKNNIPYVLMCGTLLGAVRHKGFIPWDDDFDICLFDDSYESAIKVLRLELPDDLFVEDDETEPCYFHAWAHVKDFKSNAKCDMFPQDNAYKNHGLYIDLYKLVKLPLNQVSRYQNNENLLYLQRRRKFGLIDEKDYLRRKKLLKITEQQSKEENGNRDVFTWINIYKCKTIEIDDIFPIKKLNFEDTYFCVPNNPESILKGIYGNYMELPPENKRTTHYSKVDFLE